MDQNSFSSNIFSLNDSKGNSFTRINYLDVKKSATILRAINHKLRQSIIKLLEEKSNLTVTEIYVKLRVEQSVASQHLAILRRADIVKTVREGKNIHYNLNIHRLEELNKFVKDLVAQDDE